jgi:hypothetical protein
MVVLAGGFVVGLISRLKAGQQSGPNPRALLQISRDEPGRSGATNTAPADAERFFKTQLTLLHSGPVLDEAFGRVSQLPVVKNRTDARAWLQEILQSTILNDSEIVQISLAPSSGLSRADQAAIISAVADAYMSVVGEVEQHRTQQRLIDLKRIKEKYGYVLKERRETIQKLAADAQEAQPLAGLIQGAAPSVYQNLTLQRVQLRLEKAEAETLLARRQKAPGAAAEPVRTEIQHLEERLAIIGAREKVLRGELEGIRQEVRKLIQSPYALELAALKEEVSQIEEATRKVAAEIEALDLEMQVPPRVRILEKPSVPQP